MGEPCGRPVATFISSLSCPSTLVMALLSLIKLSAYLTRHSHATHLSKQTTSGYTGECGSCVHEECFDGASSTLCPLGAAGVTICWRFPPLDSSPCDSLVSIPRICIRPRFVNRCCDDREPEPESDLYSHPTPAHTIDTRTCTALTLIVTPHKVEPQSYPSEIESHE